MEPLWPRGVVCRPRHMDEIDRSIAWNACIVSLRLRAAGDRSPTQPGVRRARCGDQCARGTGRPQQPSCALLRAVRQRRRGRCDVHGVSGGVGSAYEGEAVLERHCARKGKR